MMDTTLKTILQALNEYSSDMNKRFSDMEEQLDNRFEKIESRIDQLEDNMNARFDVIEKRVNRVEQKADGLRVDMTDVQETLDWTSTKTIKHDRKLRELAQQTSPKPQLYLFPR
jgi:chaperonin cofactor prefoldin